MNPQEMDALVARLGGDATGFNKMLDEAEKSVDRTAKKVEESGGRIEKFGSSLKNVASGVVGAFATFEGAVGLKGAIDAFAEAESAQIKLTAAIQAGGHDVAATTAEYKQFTEMMKETTVASAGMVTGMLQQAESMGVSGAAAERAVKNAQALASAQGGTADSYIRMTAALEHGKVGRLSMLLGLEEGIEGTEALTAAQERLNKMWGTAVAEGSSTAGMLVKMGNVFTGLKKDIGEIAAEAIGPLFDIFKEMRGFFKGLSKETKTAIVVIAGVSLAFGALATAIAIAGTIFNTYFGGIGLLFGVIATAITGVVVGLGGVGNTFKWIKEKAEAAWEWLAPVRQALGVLWEEIKTVGAQAWEILKDLAVDVWTTITGDAKINWEKVQTYAVDTILFIGYTLSHFKQVAGLAFDFVKMKALDFFETVLKYSSPIGYAINAIFKPFAGAQANAQSAYLESLKETLGGFQQYKANAMKAKPEDKKNAKESGKEIGKQLTDGIKEELKMTDSVVSGSIAALDQYLDYRNKLVGKDDKGGKGAGGGLASGNVATSPAVMASALGGSVAAAGGLGADGQVVPILIQIRDLIALLTNKPTVNINPSAIA